MTPLQLIFIGGTADELNERVKDYLSKIKGSRGGKAGDAGEAGTTGAQVGQAPAPIMPPANQGGFGGQPGGFGGGPAFAPLVPGAAPGGAFPAAGAPQMDPNVAALVQRINVRFDAAIASGQKPDDAVAWLRSQLGPNAMAYSLEQCRQALLQCSVPMLDNIAKLMSA